MVEVVEEGAAEENPCCMVDHAEGVGVREAGGPRWSVDLQLGGEIVVPCF